MKKLVSIVTGASVVVAFTSSVAHAMPRNISAQGTWSQGDTGPVPLANANTNFCYLTRVSGHYVGGGESVRVYEDSTQTWYVGGSSYQQGVTASANCIPYAAFTPEPGGIDNGVGFFYQNTGTDNSCGTFGCPFSVAPPPENIWQGDAAVMISGITGQFLGGGEWVGVAQATSPWAYNTFTVIAQSPNGVGAWAQALFVGRPQSGFTPSFYGPSGSGVKAGVAGVYTASASAGSPSAFTWMAPTSQSICYFTEIGGAFAGSGESVAITTAVWYGVEYWVLEVSSMQANGTFAQARCYALDQSRSW
jgi:hypothetical protein